MRNALLTALSLILLSSCARQSPAPQIQSIDGLSYSRTVPLEYAADFRADVYEAVSGGEFTLLTISGSDTYLLAPENHPAPQNLPAGVKIIGVPVQNVYLCASSVMSLFSALGSLDSVRFSSVQKKDYYIEEAVSAMESGAILYAGRYNAPDFEFLLNEGCALAIESSMIYHAPAVLEKLESLGIPVLVDKSSYEEHPLGRLEWIKVYGLLTGKFDEARRFFEERARQVDEIASLRDPLSSTPKTVAFFYISPSGMAVVRGSDDYIVRMIEIAGGKYVFPQTQRDSSPSVQISMEEFYAGAASADILIYNSSIDSTVRSMRDLLAKSPLLADFAAVRSGNLWATGKSLYQATDRIGDMILDLHSIISENGENLRFLERVE